MADHGNDHGDDDAPDETPGYRPPAPKSMEEIMKSDADDESLRKYKESLLGSGNTVGLEICERFTALFSLGILCNVRARYFKRLPDLAHHVLLECCFLII